MEQAAEEVGVGRSLRSPDTDLRKLQDFQEEARDWRDVQRPRRI